MKFSLQFQPSLGRSWPQISLETGSLRSQIIAVENCEPVDFEFDLDEHSTHIDIIYHKSEQETVIENHKIIKDQVLQLNRIWVDDVLMEPWFLTEGCYYPRYFAGILEKFSNWPTQLPSQLIWHFPGCYRIQFAMPFWPWYGEQRKKFCRPKNSDKDSERWENWSGSHKRHDDLVQEIYRLLNV